jgi:Bacterial trigger factor protein (TF)
MSMPGFVSGWSGNARSLRAPPCVSTSSLSNIRIARMALVGHQKLEVLFETDDYVSATYRLDCSIPADISKDLRKRSLAAMKATSNFPGFRKGTVPPFIMKSLVRSGLGLHAAWRVSVRLEDVC